MNEYIVVQRLYLVQSLCYAEPGERVHLSAETAAILLDKGAIAPVAPEEHVNDSDNG